MEPGDTVFVPKRPISVAVAGEVLNATSLQFQPGSTPKDYIAAAGGCTRNLPSPMPLCRAAERPSRAREDRVLEFHAGPGSTRVAPSSFRRTLHHSISARS